MMHITLFYSQKYLNTQAILSIFIYAYIINKRKKRWETFLGKIQTNLMRVVTQWEEINSFCKDCKGTSVLSEISLRSEAITAKY